MNQKKMSILAGDWGGEGAMSQLCQACKSLSFYPSNLAEAKKDKGIAPLSIRVTSRLMLSPFLKNLPTAIARAEMLADVFRRVSPGCGHEAVILSSPDNEPRRILGTWNIEQTKVNYTAMYLARYLLSCETETYIDDQWGKSPSDMAKRALADLRDGVHDWVIADVLKIANKKSKLPSVGTKVAPLSLHPNFAKADLIRSNIKMIVTAWMRRYRAQVENPDKVVPEEAIEATRLKVPRMALIEVGDATDAGDFKRIMKEATKKKLIDEDTTVVCITSPPWGVLAEGNVAAYMKGREDRNNEYKDERLTDTEINELASNLDEHMKGNGAVVLHLPWRDLGRYEDIFKKQNWEVARTQYRMLWHVKYVPQATRIPLTVVSKCGFKVRPLYIRYKSFVFTQM